MTLTISSKSDEYLDKPCFTNSTTNSISSIDSTGKRIRQQSNQEERPRILSGRIRSSAWSQRSSIHESPKKEDDSSSINSSKSSESVSKRFKDVLVGTPIKLGHPNYLLMFDMLTGIRISASRNNKEIDQLEPQDFTCQHKLAFDEHGNEQQPKSKYDFKFKDYAPMVFKKIRDLFHVEANDYLKSLTAKYVLSELGSPGKSKSFFYFSSDYRFIIKTIHYSEHKFLRRILPDYLAHIQQYPNTLLSRILGMHRVKLPQNKKIHFVVMGNVFPSNKDIHEMYDLKGSLVGRTSSNTSNNNNNTSTTSNTATNSTVMKDLNWIHNQRLLEFGPLKRDLLMNQLQRDVQFLQDHSIMDYSLLVGIHDITRGNREHIREKSLSLLESLDRKSSVDKSQKRQRSRQVSDPVQIKSNEFPDQIPSERRHCLFYQEMGGFQSTTEINELSTKIYYLGIIDIFTNYSSKKKMEHYLLSIVKNAKEISCVEPRYYGKRFIEFIEKYMKGSTSKRSKKPSMNAVLENE